jgi:hypothetical protein
MPIEKRVQFLGNEFMTSEAYEKLLEKEVDSLSIKHKIAFAASCCERMLPNYYIFSKEENFGNPEILKAGLDKIWQFLIDGKSITNKEIKKVIKQIQEITPVPSESVSIYVSPAEDAARAIICTLISCVKFVDSADIVEIADIAIQTIDCYVLERDDVPGFDGTDPKFEERIWNDPLMVQETVKQQNDLQMLKKLDLFDSQAVRGFREQSTDSSRSNIGILW